MIRFLATAYLLALSAPYPESGLRGELLFKPESQHNHGSCIVELPGGDLLACWYRGSGERTADDVRIMGSRLKRGSQKWAEPFLLADTPDLPDCNPCMIVDPSERLWLFYPTILDNHWESALLKVKYTRNYGRPGPPRWESEGVIHLKPGAEFTEVVERDLAARWEPTRKLATTEQQTALKRYLEERHAMSRNKLQTRLGWMPRAHPFLLPRAGGYRLIVPLYSDGFDFSMMALSDDAGKSWKTSLPLVGAGNVQPTLVRRRDGTLTAYFRDNGPPPQRVMRSDSRDGGAEWSIPEDTPIPNPGSGVEAIALQSGRWIMVNNDTESGRHRLSVHVSEDEGLTWPITRCLEQDSADSASGSYSYPSVIQARSGVIHVTYSYRANAANRLREGAGESIKHVQFPESWLLSP